MGSKGNFSGGVKMLFIDTANFEEAKKWIQQYGVCKGITSNQKIFSQEQGIDFKQRIKELLSLNVPVSVELVSQNCTVDDLVKEAVSYKTEFKSSNLVIKVPMRKDGKGLEVAKMLRNAKIPVNMTCLMGMNQVVLACEVGTTYASLFYRRMIDYVKKGFPEIKPVGKSVPEIMAKSTIKNCRDFIDREGFKTKIICGSIREPQDISECLVAGAHIVTVTPKILEQMSFHPKTEETITEFNNAWNQWTTPKKLYPIHNHLNTEPCTKRCPNFRAQEELKKK